MTAAVESSIFVAAGERVVPTALARGPWDPRALHGGAPAALITAALERHEPQPGTQLARLGFELLRPIPFAPLRLSTYTLRPGRRVQELAAELHADLGEEGEQLICRASALRVREVPAGLPDLPEGALARSSMPGPDQGRPVRFGLAEDDGVSFAASAMEMRWLDDPRELGPARVWMRLGPPLLPDQEPSPLARLAATADFGNGISASLPFASFLFINADLQIHLHRPPRGEWIGIEARTLVHSGGTGLAESVLHDLDGPVGRGFQALVVAPR
ncbi:MAG: thioesterase family protein [Solirubrobacteraceae bacterium]